MRTVRIGLMTLLVAIALPGGLASTPKDACAQGCPPGTSCTSSGNYRCPDWHCGWIWLGDE